MIVVFKKRLRDVGFRFDALAAWLMCQQHGVDLSDMDKIPVEEYLPSWIWSAHRSWCMFKRVNDRYDYKGMQKLIENMPKKEWDQIIECMRSTKAPESKKKVTAVKHGVSSSSLAGVPEYVKTTS